MNKIAVNHRAGLVSLRAWMLQQTHELSDRVSGAMAGQSGDGFRQGLENHQQHRDFTVWIQAIDAALEALSDGSSKTEDHDNRTEQSPTADLVQ